MKTFSKCGEELPVEEFARDRTKASGYKGFCKGVRQRQVAALLRGEPGAQACIHGEAAGSFAGGRGVAGPAREMVGGDPRAEPPQDAEMNIYLRFR
jgi:hypothetical protein